MSQTIRGVIHGRTIELLTDVDIADGQEVEMTIRPVAEPDARIAAILRTAGSMADNPEFDRAMDEVQRFRREAQFRESTE